MVQPVHAVTQGKEHDGLLISCFHDGEELHQKRLWAALTMTERMLFDFCADTSTSERNEVENNSME